MTRTLFIASAALLASPAFAHPGAHHASASFAVGLSHPFAGWDHLLAMLAVGVWAAQQKRSLALLMPLAFPLMMGLGAVLAMQFGSLHYVESGIAASVALLGLLVAFAVRMPVVAGAAIVALFGFLHGYAHGIEAPADGSMLAYGAGFIAATMMLHLAGMLSGVLARGAFTAGLLRAGGGVVATAGVALLALA
jgi:urease accessory protein